MGVVEKEKGWRESCDWLAHSPNACKASAGQVEARSLEFHLGLVRAHAPEVSAVSFLGRIHKMLDGK